VRQAWLQQFDHAAQARISFEPGQQGDEPGAGVFSLRVQLALLCLTVGTQTGNGLVGLGADG
jgi:hypothetical protein